MKQGSFVHYQPWPHAALKAQQEREEAELEAEKRAVVLVERQRLKEALLEEAYASVGVCISLLRNKESKSFSYFVF